MKMILKQCCFNEIIHLLDKAFVFSYSYRLYIVIGIYIKNSTI